MEFDRAGFVEAALSANPDISRPGDPARLPRRASTAASSFDAPEKLDNTGRSSGTIYRRLMPPEQRSVTPKLPVEPLAGLHGRQG